MTRKLISILPLLAALFLTFSCDPTKNKQEPQDTLTVNPASIAFEAEDASTKLVYVTTEKDWTATASESWIHLGKTSGTGKGAIDVTVDANLGEDRTGSITVKGSNTETVSVSQKGKHIITVVANPDAFDGNKRSSTTYQLLIYSFADSDGDGIGDFKGIQNKLDYLDGLGVTALWLSPAHPTNSYHGYDVNDYNALNPLFGTEADFKNLIVAAHAKGIKIYMDYVLNHSGTGTEWFKSVKADPKNSPYRDYYVLSNGDYPLEAVGGMGGWVSLGDGNIGYKGRLHFKVDWTGNTKYVTVTETTEAVTAPNSSNAKRWIHVGSKGSLGMHETSTNIFELTLDVDTEWGFLVRTSNDDSWPEGTKYGGKTGANVITLGKPFPLDNSTAADIVFGESTSYYASFDASMPDLNYGKPDECENSGAFQSTVESARKWVDMGVDGFRLDAVVWIYAASASANAKFLDKWYNAVNEAYRATHSDDIFMVGEAWHGGHSEEQKYYAGLPSNFEFDYWRNALLPAINNGKGNTYASTVIGYISDHEGRRLTSPKAVTSFFMTNHDKSSVKAKQNPYNDNEWLSFYRAADDLNRNLNKEKQACAMLLTTPGKPFVYQGEELGYWRIDDNDKLDDEYIRAPIVWNSSATDCARKGVNNRVDNNMLKGSISVETQSADENSLLNTYKTWIRLRNIYPALAEGTMTNANLSGSSIASWYMTADSQKLLVIHNTATSAKDVTVKDDMSRAVGLLGTATIDHDVLTLGPNSSVVFKL